MNAHFEREREIRGNVDVADFAAVGFVSFDVDAAVRIPETDGAILAAAEAIVSIGIESSS